MPSFRRSRVSTAFRVTGPRAATVERDAAAAGREGARDLARWFDTLVLAVLVALTAAVALGLVLPASLSAQVPPDAAWRSFETEHFRVTFPPGQEALARHAAERAEVAHARLAAELGYVPRGRVEIVLTDHIDQSNGTATPFPSNRIVLYAKPPVDGLNLAHFHDWIDLLVIHELTHIFHLDRAGKLGRAARTVFGRIPAPWPLFPAIGTPNWSGEGLATFVESDHTRTGRVHGSYHEMVVRTAALAGDFDPIERISGTAPTWPGPARAYIYGSLFSEWLTREHGEDAQRRLIDATAGAWIPPPLDFDRVARNALGQRYTEAYDEWRTELERRYAALADSLRAVGLTESERLTNEGYYAEHPRVGPDGRVVFAALDGRSPAATRILDPATGVTRNLSRRNGLGPSSWMPDGSILTAQLEFSGPYRIISDLYRITPDGRERRLTRGARLGEPDVASDGRRVVAIRYVGGTNQLVVHDLETGRTREITEPRADVHWALPRWSPDGQRIAVGHWERGDFGIAVVDTTGTVLNRITHEGALDMAPAWSPDGRFVLFSSDRDGITNLYAADLTSVDASDRTPTLRQVTRVLTGAFYPDVSPGGRWIYFARYDVDGFHIERMPYDPGAWHDPSPGIAAAPARLAAGPADLTESPGHEPDDARTVSSPALAPNSVSAAEAVTSRPYSSVPSLLPRYWLPIVTGSPERTGRFYGAATSGHDVVRRHAYDIVATVQPSDRLVAGRIAYAYSGFGNPTLTLEASRDWSHLHLASRPDDAPRARLLAREDVLALSATLDRQRWRSAAALSLGAEWATERRRLFDAPGYRPNNANAEFAGLFARAGFANYQRHPYSISREDGVALYLAGRVREDLNARRAENGGVDRGYREVIAQTLGYKAVPAPGFARHVLAARLAAVRRNGPGAAMTAAGGTTGTSLGLFGESGGGQTFLPIRGFNADVARGTRAWTASLEYRAPIALIDKGFGLRPLYLDRLAGAAFLDAGNAWCSAEQAQTNSACPATRPATRISAGAELGLDALLLHSIHVRVRLGLAVPIKAPGEVPGPSVYVELGQGF